MERKHGFNCNIMHESLFNDAVERREKRLERFSLAMFLAPLENLLHCKAVERTPVGKCHQSTFRRLPLTNNTACVDEVHFNYLFFHFPSLIEGEKKCITAGLKLLFLFICLGATSE